MYIGKIPEGYFEFRNKVAKNNFNDCWQSMRNKYLSCGGQIPDYIIDELVFTYAEEYHRTELLKLKAKIFCNICNLQLTDEELKVGHCFNCGEDYL